ncbi:hypothetical protein, partial [Acinetobacter baumannii]|uniref:hypothetical protein n=1 Tax=Acinetobacter baumannii TaxID=470 RepID=UPI00339A3276
MMTQRKHAKLVDFNRYRQLNHEVHRKLREECEKYWNDMASQLEEAAAKHEYRTLYRAIRRLSGKRQSLNDNIKKADGTFVRSTEESLQRWKKFFDRLYNHDPP